MKEEISVDRKCIRLTICDFGKDSNVIEKRIEKLKKMLIELEKDRSGICNCINYKFWNIYWQYKICEIKY